MNCMIPSLKVADDAKREVVPISERVESVRRDDADVAGRRVDIFERREPIPKRAHLGRADAGERTREERQDDRCRRSEGQGDGVATLVRS